MIFPTSRNFLFSYFSFIENGSFFMQWIFIVKHQQAQVIEYCHHPKLLLPLGFDNSVFPSSQSYFITLFQIWKKCTFIEQFSVFNEIYISGIQPTVVAKWHYSSTVLPAAREDSHLSACLSGLGIVIYNHYKGCVGFPVVIQIFITLINSNANCSLMVFKISLL